MSLYSSKLVGVVMMADETRTSYMTQREGVWYICKSVCMCKVCVRCVYMCAHTHTGDKGTRDTARNTPTNVPRAHPVEEQGPRISG